MTYNTTCLNCGCGLFIYDPRDYEFVRLHPEGGVEIDPDVPGERTWDTDTPEQVTCAGCGLEVERVRLDPEFDWNAKLLEFKIKIHD